MTHSDSKNSMPPPDPAPPPAGACVPVDHPIANPPCQAGLAGWDRSAREREVALLSVHPPSPSALDRSAREREVARSLPQDPKTHREDLLDEDHEETFPASVTR